MICNLWSDGYWCEPETINRSENYLQVHELTTYECLFNFLGSKSKVNQFLREIQEYRLRSDLSHFKG